MTDHLNFLGDIIGKAIAKGASAADAILVDSVSQDVSVRYGKLEKLERSASADVGLRVFIGKKQSVVSSSYSNLTEINEVVDRAVAMAKASPDDPYCGLADKNDSLIGEHKHHNADDSDIGEEKLQEWAKKAEDAAQAVKGVTKSEGGDAHASRSKIYLVNSNGLAGEYDQSSFSVSASVIAGEGTGMERDYDYSSAVFYKDMISPDIIGRKAGERAVRRLNPRKVKTQQVPVVFDPRVARGIVGYVASAINGATVARGTSFLKSKMGQQIFKGSINIIDDPSRPRALRSRPFDAEGIATRNIHFIEGGYLKNWIMDCRSARQLGLHSTGHAVRGVSSVPSPSISNFYLASGSVTPQQLMADIKQGFYVTETMGMGVNLVTGDYSQGASGFWIENGQIAYPVSEVTIAGHLSEMFMELTPANDLEFKYGVDSPTIRVGQMTLAGQ
ncbi:MAG: TldD/PmbA family protein [Alphaproteobacteria bacterium]|nr:MAG: TldD/PmbA family protein [Alphaproteobacteria bacterium]